MLAQRLMCDVVKLSRWSARRGVVGEVIEKEVIEK
jgi:hypothetical protein